MKLSEKTIVYALAEMVENDLTNNVEVTDETERPKTRLLKEAGYLTNDSGFEIKINGQTFLVKVQEK